MRRRHLITHLAGSKNRIRSQAGQAIVEYTLILCVVILLILGAFYQFNQAFRQFASGIMNTYTACLLQTGELPGNSPICSEQFKNFNPEDGKAMVKGVSDSEGGGGGGEDGKPASRRPSRSGSSDRSSGASASRAEGSGGSVGTMKSASDYFNKKGRPKQTVVGSSSMDEKNYTGSTAASSRPRLVGTLARSEGNQRLTLDRKFVTSKEEDERKKSKAPVAAGGISDSTRDDKKISYSVKRETASIGSNDEGFSFGEWLRFLLIAAIIIAIFMLLLGQGVQISKSWEK